MKNSISSVIIISSSLLAGQVSAADEAPKSLWKSSAELGFLSTSGNTKTQTLNAKATASTDREKWHHNIEFSVLKSSNRNSTTGKDETTAQKYVLTGQSDYKLDKPNFLFGLVTYDDDRFGGYDYQLTEVFGYGRRVIDKSDLVLDLTVGPGAKQTKLLTGGTDNETIVFGSAKLDWTISKTSKLAEVFTIESGENTTITKSVTSLSTNINTSLAMKLTYTYKNTSDVPPTIKKTDSETAITLVYSF